MYQCVEIYRSMTRLVYLLTFAMCGVAAAAEPVFDSLGRPVGARDAVVTMVTSHADERAIAWLAAEDADSRMVLGAFMDTGETFTIDMLPYGRSHIILQANASDEVFIYSGIPGRFFRYDVESQELIELGIPSDKSTYWLGHAVGPDDVLYVGTGMEAELVACDMKTGHVRTLGRISPDSRQKYLLRPAANDANIIFCPIGLHHMELWAVKPDTGEKKQILPDEFLSTPGVPTIWRAEDGQVYGEIDGKQFLCHEDRIEFVQQAPDRKRIDRVAGGVRAELFRSSGELVLRDIATNQRRTIKTDFGGLGTRILKLFGVIDGKLYGGTISPAMLFHVDLKTGEMTDHGRVTTGSVQIYDILEVPQGLLISSYPLGALDFYNPEKPKQDRSNPNLIVAMADEYGQERAFQMAMADDGAIYMGTTPVKGRLGGRLVRLDPHDWSVETYTNVIKNQSLTYVHPLKGSGKLLCGSAVRGGTSATPTEKEAYVFLWDTATQTVTTQFQPVRGVKEYGRMVEAENGLIYGLAGSKFYVFDPKTEEVVHVGALPVTPFSWGLSPEPVGPKGLIYGVGKGKVFTIDPADNTVDVIAQHESFEDALAFYVTQDGIIYFANGTELWRCRFE